MYHTFTRAWWKPNPAWPDGREPCAGPKTYHNEYTNEKDARKECKEYNDTHDPGPMSVKMEVGEGRIPRT